MKSALVVYGTTEGQTRRIAEFTADALKARGVEVELVDSAGARAALVQPVHAAVIVCGSVHQGRYPSSLLRFVKTNQAWLAGMPAAFVGVSLTAAFGEPGGGGALRKMAEGFFRATGWTPAMTHQVAGALRFTHYGFFKRWLVTQVLRKQGRDVDTSRDHEYTDWDGLTRFIEQFLAASALQKGQRRRDEHEHPEPA